MKATFRHLKDGAWIVDLSNHWFRIEPNGRIIVRKCVPGPDGFSRVEASEADPDERVYAMKMLNKHLKDGTGNLTINY